MNTNLLANANHPSALSMTQALGTQNLHGSRPYADYAKLDNYNDINALQGLKYKSGDQKEAAIEETAKHFESLFVSMMIKSMRDANKVFSEGNMLQSSQSDFYQQMFDSQLAVSLSSGKGIGLAEVIKRQLTEAQNLRSPEAVQGIALDKNQRFYSLEDYARLPSVSSEKMVQIEKAIQDIDAQLEELSVTGHDGLGTLQATEVAHDFSSPDKFIQTLYPYAKQVEAETGIDARLMLAQSALETGWGKHQIYKEDGSPSHNLFGIKSHRDWTGDEANITTTEYRNGVAVKEKAGFRVYDSYQDSFKDYANFLRSNNRYETALANTDDPKAFAQELQSAGYATDPNYSEKINRIIDRYLNIDELETEFKDESGLMFKEASLSSHSSSTVGG